MYKFVIKNVSNKYDFIELIKVFVSQDEFRAYTQEEFDALPEHEKKAGDIVCFNNELSADKNEIKRQQENGLHGEY